MVRIGFMLALALVLALPAWPEHGDVAKQDNWEPPPAPPQWGNTVGDGTVDYRDLIALGQNWEAADAAFGRDRNLLLQEMSAHWHADMPAVLRESDWDNRPRMGGSGLSANKQGNVPVGIGFGVRVQNGRDWVIGQQLYPAPSVGPGAIVYSLNTQALPGTNGQLAGDERYDPIEAEEYDSRHYPHLLRLPELFSTHNIYSYAELEAFSRPC